MAHRTARAVCTARLALLLLLVAAPLAAQSLPRGVTTGPSIAGITEYSYPNGLKVLLLPDPGSNTITVNMVYLVGSRHEGYGESGMAHLLEHLLFIRSTSDRDIKKELEDRGARWNGTTWYDRTNYYETVNASDENLRWALDLERERMVNMRIEQALLDTEMTVVRNEFERGENSVTGVLEERVLATAYLWHNYGRSTIGSRADIERVTIDRLAAFYRRFYQPDNAVLVIAGQFEPAKTLAMVASSVGTIPRPSRQLPRTYTAEPTQDGERTVELRRVGKGRNLMLAYHAPAMAHQDSAALEVLTGILARAGTGRLDRALIDARKALSVGASVYQLHDPGVVTLSATLSDEQSLDEVKAIMVETLATLGREGPAADVKQVAGTYFTSSNRTVGLFIPEPAPQRTTVPAAPTMDTLLKTYRPDVRVEAGEALDPAPASIEKRVRRTTLPGGLRLVLLPKGTRGGRVQAALTLRFGDEQSLVDRAPAAQLASSLLLRGSRTKSRQQIQDELQALNATLSFGSGLSSVSANISTTAENLVPALRLAAEILREPAFPDSDFQQIRAQRIAALERSSTEPGTLVSQLLQRTLSPYPRSDVRYVRTIDEELADLKAVTLEQVRAFHQSFYGASHGELVVVGRFDMPALEAAVASLLGTWTSPSPYQRIVNPYLAAQTINSSIETPDKENAQLSAGLRLRMRDSDPDYAALMMANYMFGGGITARLPDRVRNREGYSYSVSSNFSAPVEGDAAIFSASAIANPANVAKVEASFRDELSRTLKDGFTARELEAARKAIRDERIGARSSDSGLLSLLAGREQWNRTLMWDAELDAKLQALTLEQINAAFRRHIDAESISIVKGGDFTRAATR
jgi:zinc protease